jgi:hypothetical protein
MRSISLNLNDSMQACVEERDPCVAYASTLTQYDAFLKEDYTKDKIDDLSKKERPLFGRVTREEDHSGDLYVHPLIVSNPQGLGATVAKAQQGSQQTSGGNLLGKKWTVLFGDYTGSVEVGDKVIRASRNNAGAFLRNQTVEIDGLYNAFGDTFSTYLYSNGGQSVTPGGFTISSGVCTLATADDVVNIEVGQILVVSANDGSSSSHTLINSGADKGYVVAVNRNAGTFTVSTTSGGSAGTPTNWTGTMYGFRDGDFGGSGANRIILGLGAWIPGSDPSSTTFEGLDRTLDIARMSGVRLTSAEVTNLNLEQRIKRLVTRMRSRNFGPGPTEIYLNPEKWQSLADSLESRGSRDIGSDARFNYDSIKLAVAGKRVEIFADPFCPYSTGFALHMPSIKLAAYEKIPFVLNGDGLEMLRKTSSNDYEHRIQAYPAFCVPAPGYCGRVAV